METVTAGRTGRLQDKVAVITGANSGIGLAAARLFAQEGASVFATARRQRELDAAVRTIGQGARGVQSDVSNLVDLDRLFATVRDAAGTIDVLFANAGGGTFAPLGSITEEEFDTTFATNVKGTLFTVQKALPLMREGLDHPDGIDHGHDRHARLQRLQRQQSRRAQLRPKLDS